MIRRILRFLILLGAVATGTARAERFDFIYADQITMKAPMNGWGITLAGSDFGLIVNKGTADLTADVLYGATFRVDGLPVWPDTTSPMPDPVLRPGINSGYLYHVSFMPIVPNEAAGSVGPLSAVLPPLVEAGETFRNTAPIQFIYFELNGIGTTPGLARFDVHLRIGDDEASFPMFVTLIDSPSYDIEFTHAARVSSEPLVTAARNTTWGRVKRLYQ